MSQNNMPRPVLGPTAIGGMYRYAPILDTLGKVLRDARSDAGLTQEQVAAAIGVSLSCYNRVENGGRRFKMRWLPRLPAPLRREAAGFLIRRYERWIAVLQRHVTDAEPLQ